VPAQLVVGRGEVRAVLRGERVHDPHARQRQPQGRRAGPDGGLGPEHGQVDHLPLEQLVGGEQDAVVVALGQHDVPPVRPRPLDQGVLEHQRRHPRRMCLRDPLQQCGRVDAVLEQPDAVAILRGLRAVIEPRTAVTAAVTVYVSPSAAITGMPRGRSRRRAGAPRPGSARR
jgi:hypothetical protein